MTNFYKFLRSRRLRPAVCGVLFALALFLLAAATSLAAAPASPPGGPGLAEVEATKHGVRIRVIGMPLAELLQGIEAETGIRFEFPENLADELVTAHVEAANWGDALDELLQDKSSIKLWDARQRVTSIRLLGTREWEPGSASQSATLARTAPGNTASPRNNGGSDITLTKEQLGQISKGPYRSPLPETLYRNLALRPFLEKYGIASEADLKDTRKAMRVRREARKQLRILRKKERAAKAGK